MFVKYPQTPGRKRREIVKDKFRANHFKYFYVIMDLLTGSWDGGYLVFVVLHVTGVIGEDS